ncbi:MAG: hypothetical protein EOP48_22595, partial [Sphingobacteriales bacterium]
MCSSFIKGFLFSCLVVSFAHAANKPAPHAAKPSKQAPVAAKQVSDAPASNARKAERVYYAEAQTFLDNKQFTRYKQLLPFLKNYPLVAYLEYQELGDRLMALPTKEVEQFFNRYPNSYVSERMRHRWLRALAIKEVWPEYRR